MFVHQLKVASMVAALSVAGVTGAVLSSPNLKPHNPTLTSSRGTTATAATVKEVSAEVKFVAEGIANARNRPLCAQANVSYQQFTPKEFFALERTLPRAPQNLPHTDEVRSQTAALGSRVASPDRTDRARCSSSIRPRTVLTAGPGAVGS